MDLISLFYTEVIPYALMVMMFGMGLSLTVADIARVLVYPKAVTIGLIGQLVLLPALTFAIVTLLDASPVIAAGAIILAACPGGITSNAYVFAARGDTALSVTLTAIASFVTVVTIPLFTFLALNLYSEAAQVPDLPVSTMMRKLATLAVLPILCGMVVRARVPNFAIRAVESFRTVTLIILIAMILAGTAASWDKFVTYLPEAGLVMATLNVAAMTMGYWIASVFKLSVEQRISITYELGVQNLSLAFLVTLSILNRPELAIATIIYAVFLKITALSFLAFSKRMLATAPTIVAPLGD